MNSLIQSIIDKDLYKTKKLIADGSDVNEPDGDGNTSVYYFLKHSDYKNVLEALKDAGAELDKKNNNGFTPFMMGIIYGFSSKNLINLIESGACVNEKGWYNRTVAEYFLTYREDDTSLLDELKNKGADFDINDADDADDMTLLMRCI